MKKSDWTELARLGVRQRLADIERVLAEMFAEFPEEFVSPTAPVLRRPEKRGTGGGWPALTVTPPNGSGNGHHVEEIEAEPKPPGGAWTPERRAKQARRMKKLSAHLHMAKAAIRKRTRRGRPPQAEGAPPVWRRMHDFLAGQEHHSATASDIKAALGLKNTVVLYTSVPRHLDLFAKPKGGVFRLKKALAPEAPPTEG